MKLIIGLGNPGSEYADTRHNAGFRALDALVEEFDGRWSEDAKRKAEVAKVTVGGESVILAKPATYMNLSGEAATALASFYKVNTDDLLVVHDEMDLEPGRLQFKGEGGDAGHNGIASVQQMLGTERVARLRIGVGRPDRSENPGPANDHVLGVLSPDEQPDRLDLISAMRDWIEGGLEKASNTWNRKTKE